MATNAANAATPQAVIGHVQKLGDADPDFRFMSLNDLLQLLTTARDDFLQHDYNIAARTVDGIIKTLDDQNGEVQNLAIKCLGPLVGKVPTPIIAPMIDKLSSLKLKNSVDTAVPALALRAVITALPRPIPGIPSTPGVQEAYNAVSRVLIPRLIGLLQDENGVNAEAVDVLVEVVRCFGPLLQQVEVEAMQEVVLQLLQGDKATSVVKKRAVVAISMLAVYLSDAHLEDVINRITAGLSESSIPPVTRRLYISIMGSMARSIPPRFGTELEEHLEKISDGDDLGPEFNEIRETALVALEAFLASCPQEMRPFTDASLAACLRYLKYDPNYAVDDDEEMDVDEEEEEDQDDEFEDDDGFEDDDDDASWKVRRCAAKAIYTLISTRGSGDLLDNGVLYNQAAPNLVKRIEEREENVRLEIISALSLLIRKTGEGLHTVDLTRDEYEPEIVSQMPLSRKRRRQSSAGGSSAAKFMAGTGITSLAAEKIPSQGPRADLSKLTPTIVKAATKQLRGKTVPTKQAIISMLDDLVSVQHGGLVEFFPEIIGPIIEAVKTTGTSSISSSLAAAGGSASATPSTLRVASLKLISDIAKTHSSSVLQPYLSKVVAGVASAVHDRFYKISSEAIRTSEELVKAITPPRSRNGGSKFKDDLDKLYEVIVDRGSANDADAEVRQRAIHALGILISRTSGSEASGLLSAEKRTLALNIIQERLRNETTRLAAVRAVDNVAAFAVSPDQLEQAWVQDVALELSAQLRKANRSLRGSSIQALKHLVLSKATQGKLEPATIQGIVSALLPTIKNSDTHLLGPTLIILGNMVQGHANLIINDEMIGALCQLLKSHFANIVLDQLLDLISRVGESGAGEPLMQGLLKDVSVQGDPIVVGKVIGTLLVTGGTSAGVSLDSFVTELHGSTQRGDEAGVSLALAVLGESGMRLGAKSPLQPQLFLEQFHAEPDKVSLAAAIALGRAGSGNVPEYLPVILKTMEGGGNTQYLLIQSIKEILQSISSQSTDLQTYAKAIWDQLIGASLNADNKIICAECVGRLATLDPATFMPKLQTLLKDESSGIRGMAVQAVRYTLPESDETFDAMLRNVLIEMLLTMLQDSDMEIRRLAMTTLNSAAHNKPDLILPHLGELLPFVLSESVIKKELIREVMLGPFKHKVDDGLEVRKSAYETLYALMETAFTRINNIDFYDRVIAGLKDDNDIRQLCNLMVTKLIVIDPDETARRLDSIAEAYRGVLSIKLKDNAVKQDVEKQEETNKSILRVTLLLGDKMKAMTGNAGAATSNAAAAGAWTGYWEWANKEFDRQLKGLREESSQLHTRTL
ncbi:TATA-binding protein interacting (TIP20) domain-containing protein [Trichoderma breve]|uniref:TATA-binding protein interacting (TIP20) domain-containing protein n=1 Tax=Trichoderma breve TaxID=2034170 RepID=A0A9W9EC89_9HYPO|nr:TATA-binding protein interacting (TIP20) domain-containing protein [Trichoderma breve]KAJ4864003.1 TATA-binding protein interacting (TIP20) domain-containing protein [Trichoderma breve]